MKKSKIIVGVIIAVLVITVIVESILLGVGYYSRVPKLKNGEEEVVSLSTGTKYSVDDLYKKVKSQYGLTALLDLIDAEILDKEYGKDKSIESYVETKIATVKANYPDENKLNQVTKGAFDEVDTDRSGKIDKSELDKLIEIICKDMGAAVLLGSRSA